jgi:hypothetical protein
MCCLALPPVLTALGRVHPSAPGDPTRSYISGVYPRTSHFKAASKVQIQFDEAAEVMVRKTVSKGAHRFFNFNSWPGRT